MLSLKDLPMPPASGLLGHVSLLNKPDIHKKLVSWSKNYGDLYRIKLGLNNALVVCDRATIQEILKKRPSIFRRSSLIEDRFEEAGINGVFSSEGDNWVQNRQLSEAIFVPNHIQNFTPILMKITQRLHKRFLHLATTDADVDLLKEFKRYTVDITTNLAFGEDLNTLNLSESKLEQSLELIFPMINQRCLSPIPLWRYMKMPADRRFDSAINYIKEQVQKFIQHQKALLIQNPSLSQLPQNMLQMMLIAQQKNQDLSDEMIIANAVTMLLAGEDTTANTLTWMVHQISDRPLVKQKILNELTEIDFKTTPEILKQRFTYITAIALEAMRQKPVAPLLYIETNKNTVVQDVTVKAGTLLILALNACSNDKSVFERSFEFEPERWLGSHSNSTNEILPFGGGSRMCPGRSLAMTEIKLAFSTLMKDFDVIPLQSSASVEEHFAFTLSPKTFMCKIVFNH
ncbi:cytochrome P450 [Shewanella sp. OPT22]|nr:cytochrome P450 [Shewanella sp. OPT22]